MRPLGAALVCLTLVVAATPVRAQSPMPAVRPLWTLHLGDLPQFVGFEGGHVIALSGGRLVRVRLADGAPAGSVVLAGCGASYPAAKGDRFLVWDRVDAPSPHGLLVECMGGTGNAPVHWAGAIDPASLAPRWRVDGGGANVQPVAERAGSVILETVAVGRPIRLSSVEAANGAARWSLDVPDVPAQQCMDVLQDDATVVLVSCRGPIVAVDRASGRRRWATDAGGIRFARLAGDALLVAGEHVALAIDAATGRVRWRFRADAPIAALEAIGGGLVGVAVHAGDLVAIDLDTGAIRWRAAIGGASWIGARGELVAVAGRDLLLVLGRADGRERMRFATGGVIEALRWSGEALIGIARTPIVDDRVPTGYLTVFDLATGATRRHARPVAADSPVLATGDLALACSSSGVVHAVDARTGRGRWRAFVGRPGTAETVAGPCSLFASDPDGVVLALGADQVLSAFDARSLLGGPRAGARVVVRGEVVAPGRRAGIRVLVGDVWAHTDDAGRFEVALRGAGRVTAQVDPRDAATRCAWSTPASAVLRGQPQLRLRVARDHCACHDCD